jgi:hypothetical protein
MWDLGPMQRFHNLHQKWNLTFWGIKSPRSETDEKYDLVLE